VSIVTATRNRPDVLRRALASIRSQTFEEYEVIVVDDGSRSDVQGEYEDIWRSLDPRFLLVREGPPGGPGSGPGVGRNRVSNSPEASTSRSWITTTSGCGLIIYL
jgi:cellulose synthase/poly-beta-1,6-N-acetylglucosamine synthase-like glycosyltransferase